MPEIYVIFVRKISPRFFEGGGRILLPTVSYAYEFCVAPPLGLYFLCRLALAQGRPKTPLPTQNASQNVGGGTKFKFAQLILRKIIKIVAIGVVF